MQPVMPPVFETQALGDTLLSVATQVDEAFSESLPWKNFFAYLQASWKERHGETGEPGDFDAFWRHTLQQGGVWRAKAPLPVQLSQPYLR